MRRAIILTVACWTDGYRFGNVRISALIENLLNEEWNEAQFDTESLLKGELIPVSEIHLTPGIPRSIQLGISVEF